MVTHATNKSQMNKEINRERMSHISSNRILWWTLAIMAIVLVFIYWAYESYSENLAANNPPYVNENSVNNMGPTNTQPMDNTQPLDNQNTDMNNNQGFDNQGINPETAPNP